MGATQIIVIRHAEKPDTYGGTTYYGVDPTGQTCVDNAAEHLVTIGWQRAGGLVTLFAPLNGGPSPFARPATLFASNPVQTGPVSAGTSSGDGPSQRPYETLLPMAAALGAPGKPLAIDTSHEKSDLEGVVAAALACEGVVLICWQHEDIPLQGQGISWQILDRTGTAVNAFPSIPETWPVNANVARYDLVFVFDRPTGTGPITKFTLAGQFLLAGDGPPPESAPT